jgi:hypothetical protein
MKGLILILAFIGTSAFAADYYSSDTPVKVNGYWKKDGDYVNSYYRSRPNQNNDSYNFNKKYDSSSSYYGDKKNKW